jgi:hypothetical protein
VSVIPFVQGSHQQGSHQHGQPQCFKSPFDPFAPVTAGSSFQPPIAAAPAPMQLTSASAVAPAAAPAAAPAPAPAPVQVSADGDVAMFCQRGPPRCSAKRQLRVVGSRVFCPNCGWRPPRFVLVAVLYAHTLTISHALLQLQRMQAPDDLLW